MSTSLWAKNFLNMTEKEKIEEAKRLYKTANADQRYVLESLFPELKESEDEKIRKVIYGWIYTQPSQFFDSGFSKEEILAWLEKQGESDETKAKTFLINKGYPIDANGVFPTYEEIYNIIREGLEKQDEQKSIETTWKPSEEQIKILDEILNFAANHESLYWNDYIFGTLNNLIRQLKELKNIKL